ncbi:hypothetical protein AVEN_92470-1 [Araneus ventricosus]|uniref:Uncharacterized protein n=1 Tax=Araneus ventricosus TaxID=182803 RepID=A0A4Y2AHI3_ARAVE|nr:hypothetical protein AVEN_92470-1 [Araneus ventricosus]
MNLRKTKLSHYKKSFWSSQRVRSAFEKTASASKNEESKEIKNRLYAHPSQLNSLVAVKSCGAGNPIQGFSCRRNCLYVPSLRLKSDDVLEWRNGTPFPVADACV